MTARAENQETARKDGVIQAHPVLAAEKIWKGVPVILDGTSGFLQENDGTTITLANGDVFAGISLETIDNSDGANGDLECRVYQTGSFLLEFSDTLDQGDNGALVYMNNVSDDSVVTITSDTGNPQLTIGHIVRFVDATHAYVSIDKYVGNIAANGA